MESSASVGCFQSAAMQKAKNVVCSKPAVGFALVTTLAVAILGGLALLGAFYPNALGALAGTLGKYGTYAMLGGGLALFALTLIAAFVCSRCSGKKKQSTRQRSLLGSEDSSPHSAMKKRQLASLIEEKKEPVTKKKPGPEFKEKKSTGTGSLGSKGSSTRSDKKHDNASF